MRKKNLYFVILAAVMVSSLFLFGAFQRPILKISLFDNSMLNLILAFVVTAIPVAILMILLTNVLIGKSERGEQNRLLTLKPTDAPVMPVRWLRMGPGWRWTKAGPIVAAVLALLIVLMKVSELPPTAVVKLRFVPDIIIAILLAAVYALLMEMIMRFPIVAYGEYAGVASGGLVTFCLIFTGLFGYYFSLASGIVGAIIGAALGGFAGKALIETRTMFWPWLIHFVPAAMMMLIPVMTA